MKQRILKLTPEELIRILQSKPTQQLNLPPDTELISIKYNAFTKQVTAVLNSNTFEDAPEGTPTSEFINKTSSPKSLPQQLQTTPTTVPPSVNISNTASTETLENQVNPTTPQKSLIQTLTPNPTSSPTSISAGIKTLGPKPEANIDTCGFEDEFTKEQRKVLKFASEGDFVIVKPIQFLKTEWEDINDTVKSIGGKWVKGGTIDYWAIPKNFKQNDE
ncbi:MAG: hypothetical protein LBB87_02230 [Nitrososphaerota archaeon]|jgi:hypothetical protein|nr:hypothetical protein [Nitrososphaerota archaeon]